MIINVPAYMNHGRWVGDCTGPCMTGAAAFPGEECDECLVLGTYSFIVPVLPGNSAEIEEALCLRPEARTRNWIGETVDKLHRETRDYLWPHLYDPEDAAKDERFVDKIRTAARKAARADRPRREDGKIEMRQDWHDEDVTLGPPRKPIRTRGRRIYIPPHLPEGWSEGGIPLVNQGGN